MAKLFHLDCKREAWSGKNEKNWIWAVPGLSGQKSNFGLNNGRPRIFFSIFLFRTNENKICSSAKKVFSKKCIFGRFTANWPFGLLLHLFFPAIKNKYSENKSNSFLQKNHLLFYGHVQKMPFQPIGGRLAVWDVTASIFSGHQKQMLRKWK